MSSNKIKERGDSVENVKVVSVIQAVTKKGSGTENDPYREVVQYWTLNGELLSEKLNYDSARIGQISPTIN